MLQSVPSRSSWEAQLKDKRTLSHEEMAITPGGRGAGNRGFMEDRCQPKAVFFMTSAKRGKKRSSFVPTNIHQALVRGQTPGISKRNCLTYKERIVYHAAICQHNELSPQNSRKSLLQYDFFLTNSVCKGPVSKYGHILRFQVDRNGGGIV